MKNYKGKIEQELTGICQDILDLLEEHLVPNSTTDEGKVFLNKMKADYHRYIAEFAGPESRNTAAKKAQNAYEEASGLAKTSLTNTHPMKLGLALNHSVFMYEIMQNPDVACRMAR